MERLTERIGCQLVRIIGCDTLYQNEERKRTPTPSAIARLAAYEDSGLTPEEVAELKILWDMYGGEEGITAAFEAKAELEKIVRCKDCRHHVNLLGENDVVCKRELFHDTFRQPNDFCSYGEKKGE